MARCVYISTVAAGSGKILFALGLIELALRQTARVGFFRPVIQASEVGGCDEDIELIRRHFGLPQSYEASYAWTLSEIQELFSKGQEAQVLERVIERFKVLEAQNDFVLIEGSDFLGQVSALEIDLNALLARNLSAPVLVVGNAHGRGIPESLEAMQLSVDAYEEKNCHVIGVALNKASEDNVFQLAEALEHRFGRSGKLVGAFPYDPVLVAPSLREVAEHLGAEWLFGQERQDDSRVCCYLVAAMHLQNLLPRLQPDQLIVTPGDRVDVLLGLLEADRSVHYPRLVGLLLTTGMRPDPAVMQLVDGLRDAMPVLAVTEDTYTVAARLKHVHVGIRAEDRDKIERALSLFERHADCAGIVRQFSQIEPSGMTPRMFTYNLMQRARSDRRHIVLPEASDGRVLKAAAYLLDRRVVSITLLGRREDIERVLREQAIALDLSQVQIIDPATSPLLQTYATTYYELRRHKGMTLDTAQDCLMDGAYYGTMMVYLGHADGMVSGAIHTTQHTIRPALQFIKTQPGCSVVSSVFFMCLNDTVVVYGDCAVNPDPTAEELAEIAISSADTARHFGVEPRVALLSYSTGESGAGEEVDKVRSAVSLARARRPDLALEGPIQYDAAVDEEVAALKMPGSAVAGHATVFVFPDLNTGNNTYKAVQRESGAIAIGPILQGLRKPVNDLSRGCSVEDIINTVVITALQAQS
mgnify:FL=1